MAHQRAKQNFQQHLFLYLQKRVFMSSGTPDPFALKKMLDTMLANDKFT